MSDVAEVEVAVGDGASSTPTENKCENVITVNGGSGVVEVVNDELKDGGDDDAASETTTPPMSPEKQANASDVPGARLARKDSINSTDYRAMAARATATARLNRLGAGKKSAFRAKMSDIGALGIGLQLYFMLTKYLAVAFFIMGIIALPSIVLNKAGHGITSKMVDPLQLGYASLGNQGVSEDIASDPRLCLPRGDIDCNWTTVNTPFTSSPAKVSWILTISDCTYSIVFLFFLLFYRVRAKSAIDVHMNENLTPAKYAVFVKGLPPDATEAEILQHFNTRYDLTKEEEYNPLWFGMCWAKRRKAKHTLSRNAINRSTVKNLDHLAGTQSINKDLYLNTWIAEVSVGHPTGGLLRTFLSMETLTQTISETRELIKILEHEKMASLSTFKKRDERLIHSSRKRLKKLEDELEKQRSKIKSIKQANNAIKKAEKAEQKRVVAEQELKKSKKKKAHAKVVAAAKAAKIAAMATNAAFNWDVCECAFIVFNNLESRRRCLQDYRSSTRWLPHRFQPKSLRFRNGQHRLVVTPAPEPSNILWENLEVTDRGRFYRRSLTNFVTFLLLLASAAIISGAQFAQQQFKTKMPPAGLCDRSLPQVFYGASTAGSSTTRWNLRWYPDKQCQRGSDGKKQFYIAYDNGIVNPLNVWNPAPVKDATDPPVRCTSPCISESVEQTCSTLPCFDQDLLDSGATCETYQVSHTLYCLCTKALTDHIDEYGIADGAKRLWNDVTPCRGFIKDYLKKNGLIIAAAAVVVVVNMILNIILRCFADFERHSSESAKATAIALKMFLAQFLNTAVIVLLVNASLGLQRVPVIKELLKGKYRDFERDWYPTVGMGITTTMLLNAFTPQLVLSLQMFVIAPLRRCWSRQSIRTQKQMDKLYAGPQFDISLRYPLVLNSLFVTMVFCGGSPILLFIAAVTALGTYWLDKLSIIHLYSVNTAYDEELGELAIVLLPWTLVGHLAFSTWMYGNKELMKSTTIDLPWLLKRIGLKSLVEQYGDENSEALYNAFLEKASQVDVLGKYGFLVKVVRSNVMLIFLFFVGSVLCVLISMIWVQFVWPLLTKIWDLMVTTCCAARRKPLPPSADAPSTPRRKSRHVSGTKPPPLPVILPEFTDFFRKSVKPSFRPDSLLGFQRNGDGELVRMWMEPHNIHGVKHLEGEQMRTWEAMQAPVKSYAIEMNEKYRLAYNEIVMAARLLREASEKAKSHKTIPIPDGHEEEAEAIMADITATEPVSVEHHAESRKVPAVASGASKVTRGGNQSNRSSSSSSEASTTKK